MAQDTTDESYKGTELMTINDKLDALLDVADNPVRCPDCQCEDSWDVYRCDYLTRISSEDIILDGTFGKNEAIAADGDFCLAVKRTSAKGNHTITADFLSKQGSEKSATTVYGKDSGHPGFIYNYKDQGNFDCVFYRPHHRTQDLNIQCIEIGYKENGNYVNVVQAHCIQSMTS